jgi:hypothetical protein
MLSHWTTCAMAWFNVEGFGKVSSKSFTSPCNQTRTDLWTLPHPKKHFKVIEQGWLMFQQRCEPSKGRAWQQGANESNLNSAKWVTICLNGSKILSVS